VAINVLSVIGIADGDDISEVVGMTTQVTDVMIGQYLFYFCITQVAEHNRPLIPAN
jgi:hypothetical protein